MSDRNNQSSDDLACAQFIFSLMMLSGLDLYTAQRDDAVLLDAIEADLFNRQFAELAGAYFDGDIADASLSLTSIEDVRRFFSSGQLDKDINSLRLYFVSKCIKMLKDDNSAKLYKYINRVMLQSLKRARLVGNVRFIGEHPVAGIKSGDVGSIDSENDDGSYTVVFSRTDQPGHFEVDLPANCLQQLGVDGENV